MTPQAITTEKTVRVHPWEVCGLGRAPARKAASYHLGAVGERVTISATVEFTRCIYQGVNSYDPDRWMTKLRTDDGAVVVWFGAYALKDGEKVTGTATVKKLDRYQDEAQTIVKNPRWRA